MMTMITNTEVETVVKEWLRTASDRSGGRNNPGRGGANRSASAEHCDATLAAECWWRVSDIEVN
jgi:hypothetical protein